jgi:hypothetical protein
MVGSDGPRMLRLTLPHVAAWNSWYENYGNSAEGFAAHDATITAAARDAGPDHPRCPAARGHVQAAPRARRRRRRRGHPRGQLDQRAVDPAARRRPRGSLRQPPSGNTKRSRCPREISSRRARFGRRPGVSSVPARVCRPRALLTEAVVVVRFATYARPVLNGADSAAGAIEARIKPLSIGRGPMTVPAVLDSAGRRSSPAATPGYNAGRPPRSKGRRYARLLLLHRLRPEPGGFEDTLGVAAQPTVLLRHRPRQYPAGCRFRRWRASR